jgi:hypothetical protein
MLSPRFIRNRGLIISPLALTKGMPGIKAGNQPQIARGATGVNLRASKPLFFFGLLTRILLIPIEGSIEGHCFSL